MVECHLQSGVHRGAVFRHLRHEIAALQRGHDPGGESPRVGLVAQDMLVLHPLQGRHEQRLPAGEVASESEPRILVLISQLADQRAQLAAVRNAAFFQSVAGPFFLDKTGCRVRLNSANHQWGKDPPKEVVG